MSQVVSMPDGRKPRKWGWIIGISAFVLFGCVGTSALLWFMYIRPVETAPLTDRELAAMVRYEDFVDDFDLETPSNGTVVANKERYLDRAWTASYEFTRDDLYIQHQIDYEPKASDAILGFNMTLKSTEWGYSKEEDVSLREDSSFMDLGDDRKFWRLMNKNGVVGFVVILRKGKFVVGLTVSGIDIDRDSFDRIIAPKFASMESVFLQER